MSWSQPTFEAVAQLVGVRTGLAFAPARRDSAELSVRVVIADDQALVRAGFRKLLEVDPEIEVIAEAGDGLEAVEAVGRLQPDVVLMDIRMPDQDGLTATRALKREFPGICIVIVTMHENVDYLLEAVKAGAVGYVLKGSAPRELI